MIHLLITSGYILLGAVVFLWGLLRIFLFLELRLDSITLPPDTVRIASFFHRIILLLLAVIPPILVFPMPAMQVYIGRAFHPSSGDIFAFIIIGSLSLYCLAAFILNFPGFPLSLHCRLFWPVHLILIPCLITLLYPIVFIVLILIAGLYMLFWRWHLKERME